MVGDDDMYIITLHDYLYELELVKMERKIMIWGEHWDDLITDYEIYFSDHIVVNLNGDREFMKVYVYDKHRKPTPLINKSKKGYIYTL
jgi:hypothetical protein